MHGRIKIRTTEEERERKKKEQLLKVKAYKHAMGKIQEKRQLGEFDDEMLKTSSLILLRNPDISTLWNIRRDCVLSKVELLKRRPEEQEEVDASESETKMYEVELSLTEQCLVVNPKSYCAWHHRCWTLEHSPKPNWDREVQLCNKYLKLDERNFHTWDYRRYVVEKAGVAKEQELDFCTEKIKVNFSNYSSWHHRSLLLPQLYPYEGDDSLPKRPMSEEKLQEELEMVLTAAFTDPNDSSAWFYQRWLLSCSRPELDVCAFRCNGQKAILSFTKPVAADAFGVTIRAIKDAAPIKLLKWTATSTDNAAKVNTTWLAPWPADAVLDETAYQLEIDIPNVGIQTLPLKRLQANDLYYFKAPNPTLSFTDVVLKELRSQLDSCNSLLEYEPDSKWTLLTTALLMHAIDREKYHNNALEYLNKLEKVDGLRKGYYRDLASKWILEKVLSDWSSSGDIPKQLSLADQTHLSSLYYAQYFSIADTVKLPAALQETVGIDEKLKTFSQLNL